MDQNTTQEEERETPMKEEMLLAINPAAASANEQSSWRPFSNMFAANQEAKVIPEHKKKNDESSPGSSTRSQSRRENKGRKREQEPEQVGRGLTDMAQAQASLCHWEKAFELWDQALELQKNKLGPRHVVVASTYARRGSASARLGQWYPAALDLERAAHIFQETNNDERASETLIQLAEAQEHMGHLDEAVTNMEMALALREKLNDKEGVARLNILIGNVHHKQRNYERALESYRVGLECYEQAGVDKNHPHVVWATRRAADRSMQGHLFWASQARKETTDGDSTQS